MYCVYYNNVKVAEMKEKEDAIELYRIFPPPVGTTIKIIKEEKIIEWEYMGN